MEAGMAKHVEEMDKLKKNSLELLQQVEHVFIRIFQSNEQYEREAKAQIEELESISEQLNFRVEQQINERKEKEHHILFSFEQKIQFLR